MSSRLKKVIIRTFVLRLIFAFILLSLSSISLGVHFALGNSFSVIHDWFENNFTEIICYSSIILYLSMRYLNFHRKLNPSLNNQVIRTSIPLAANTLVLLILFNAFKGTNPDLLDLRSTFFLTLFFIFDFLVNYPGEDNYKIHHHLGCGISSTFSTAMILFLFFGYDKKLSYSFMYLQILPYLIGYSFRFEGKNILYFIFILYWMFFVGIEDNLFFPSSNDRVLTYCLIFFILNLLILSWHYLFNKKHKRSVI